MNDESPNDREREELISELNRLKAENENLKRKGGAGLYFQVSPKGGVSVYGLGRFPTTLYKQQWLRLLDATEEIRAFIHHNEARLTEKPGVTAKDQ